MNQLTLTKYLLFLGFLILSLIGAATAIKAQTFELPDNGNTIVGQVMTIKAQKGDTFHSIARHYDLGYYQLVEANPSLHPDHLRRGAVIKLPNRYVLPNVPYRGIVVNLAELRLYYFPPDKNEVVTFPIGAAKQGWLTTPLGELKIIQHKKNPHWYVPKSIRLASLRISGEMLPKVVPPGEDNPLGKYMMRLSKPSYLIHGTNDPTGVGRRSTSGCISLYPEDIEKLYHMVKKGTQVRIINEPYKVGWFNGQLYLESHVPLTDQHKARPNLKLAYSVVDKAIETRPAAVNWNWVRKVAKQEYGIPEMIGSSGKL